MKNIIFVLFSFVLLNACECHIICTPVFITLSSSIRSKDFIHLNWDYECDHRVEYVALFNVDPIFDNQAKHLVRVRAKDYPKLHYVTNVTIGNDTDLILPGGWTYASEEEKIPGPQCLPFWIASYNKNNKILKTNCLKIQPTWMNDNKKIIGDMQLSKLLIPGTHYSGGYTDQMKRGVQLGFQNRNIWSQLAFGIRYLHVDLYIEKDRINANVKLLKIRPLQDLLVYINEYLKHAPKEIVILNFNHLEISSKYTDDAHIDLLTLIKKELEWAIVLYPEEDLPTGGPTVNDIWATGKQLIICLDHHEKTVDEQIYWPHLKQFWADAETNVDLQTYMHNQTFPTLNKNRAGNPMWSLVGALKNYNDTLGVRKKADESNVMVTRWLRNFWWAKSNIIAVDFFLGSNIIELSLLVLEMKMDKNDDTMATYCEVAYSLQCHAI